MRRQYTRERYLEIVEKFRRWNPDFAFSTDVIVGFPGETEDDFQQTMSLLEAVRYESMFSFKYSPRPYTDAEHWTDDQTEIEKTRRLMQFAAPPERDPARAPPGTVIWAGNSRSWSKDPLGTAVNIFGRTANQQGGQFPGSGPSRFLRPGLTSPESEPTVSWEPESVPETSH